MKLAQFFRTVPVLVAIATTLPLATAVELNYAIGNGSVIVDHSAGNGLLINTAPVANLSSVAFSLNDGESETFDFFHIYTNEGSVEWDDLVPRAINATLDFEIPVIGALVSGLTFGGNVVLAQWGAVQWGQAAVVNQGGRTFEVSLSNEVFNAGWFGLDEGPRYGATVKATVTQISSNVPDSGSTVALLGLAVAGLGIIARRRR
jgi:hypothetical protein